MQGPQHFAGGAALEKRLKDQHEATLDLQVGIFDHEALGLAYETDGQGEGEFAPLRFGEHPSGQARPDGMEFQLGELAL
jgi:hypothetical protein